MFRAVLAAAVMLVPTAALAQSTSTGKIPLPTLGTGMYQGFQGGLYPLGRNTPPPGHFDAAVDAANRVLPRGADGNFDPNGLIVMLSIGMSNTNQEFSVFERQEDASTGRNARVIIVNGAVGGQAASVIANPAANYWTIVNQRLAALGLTAAQVQVVWIKEANAGPPDNFPLHAQQLRDDLRAVVQNVHDKFPNCRLAYLSSRIYGGYAAPATLNPEPQAYESGFSVKWLIEQQITGDPSLNHGGLPGAVRAPVLLWGPYLWADGVLPRYDGLTWVRDDFEGDATHPAPGAEQKVADLLSDFFAQEPTAITWWSPRVDATLVTIDAIADAFVFAGQPAANFGTGGVLSANGGATPRNIYLSFDASSLLPSRARFVKLGMRVTSNSSGGGAVGIVDDSSWTEGTITFAGAPAIGAVAAQVPQVSRDGTFTGAVTEAVNTDADKIVSFAVTSTAAGTSSYVSREGGQAPRLSIVISTRCRADFNLDGTLDPDDLADYITCFFAPPPCFRADFNGDGSVDPDDLSDYVTEFFGGCG